MFNVGLIVGRFQGIHCGHTKIIDTALGLCKKVIIMIGSAQEFNTKRNPFNYSLRLDMIYDLYSREIYDGFLQVEPLNDMTSEYDITYLWGRYVLDNCPIKPDIMFYGNDDARSSWFHKEDIKGVSELIFSRHDSEIEISSTNLRSAILKGDMSYINSCSPKLFNKRIPELKKILEGIK